MTEAAHLTTPEACFWSLYLCEALFSFRWVRSERCRCKWLPGCCSDTWQYLCRRESPKRLREEQSQSPADLSSVRAPTGEGRALTRMRSGPRRIGRRGSSVRPSQMRSPRAKRMQSRMPGIVLTWWDAWGRIILRRAEPLRILAYSRLIQASRDHMQRHKMVSDTVKLPGTKSEVSA